MFAFNGICQCIETRGGTLPLWPFGILSVAFFLGVGQIVLLPRCRGSPIRQAAEPMP